MKVLCVRCLRRLIRNGSVTRNGFEAAAPFATEGAIYG